MNNLSSFLQEFRYAGLAEHEVQMCLPEVKKRNAGTLGWFLIVMLSALAVLVIVSLIPGSGEESNRTLYLIFFCLMLVQWLVFKLYFEQHSEYVPIASHIFMLTAYAFGIYEAVGLGADSTGTVFCIFLVVSPLLVTDLPPRLTAMTIVIEIALLVCDFLAKDNTGDRFIVINSLCSTFLGICCGFVIQKTKFSDIRNHLMLEIQRDTDMMTGACSRVAYIRDLGVMTSDGVSAGVIFADVNGLKRTNDTLGHEAGDRLIKRGFNLMLRYFHEDNDRIYRIGGDEFVIISFDTDKNKFESRFHAMSECDEERETISFGGIWLEKVQNAEDAVKTAEKLMYAQKGRFYRDHPEFDRRKNRAPQPTSGT